MDADSKQLGLKIEIEGQEDPKEDAPSMHVVCIIFSWDSQYDWQAIMA